MTVPHLVTSSLVIFSDNSVDHALFALAAMHAACPRRPSRRRIH
jgi:hypothetical protein